MLTIIAVVPASRLCSARLSATLYAPNQATPKTTTSSHSRPVIRTHLRPTTTAPSTIVPTVSRARASAPPSKCGATPRMTTNALAHASTVIAIATTTRTPSPVCAGGVWTGDAVVMLRGY